MRKNLVSIFGAMILILFYAPAEGAIIPNSEIQVFGSHYHGPWVPENTISDDLGDYDYWAGKDDLQIGDVNWLVYQFNSPYILSQIDFYLLNTNPPYYFMGELDIQVSQITNPTFGSDGDWTTLHHVNGDYNPGTSFFSKTINDVSTSWVRLRMEYQGHGAHGGSPAFYLNEIDFYGDPVPIPSAVWLLGSGLIGIVGIRKKFKG